MNWKAVIRWTLISLVLLLLFSVCGSFLHGFWGGFADLDMELSLFYSGLFSIAVFVTYYFKDFLYVFGIIFSAVSIWAFLSLRYPEIEKGDRHKLLFVLYGLGYMVIFWAIFPISDLPVFWGGIFTFFSLLLPRFLSRKLAFGIFLRKPNVEEAIAIEVVSD